MGTGINHLVRRKAGYLWRRRLPQPLAAGLHASIARSLGTNDPVLARRRARACSAAFDRAMLSFMAGDSMPTRADLKALMDAVFRRILDDGEQSRADRAHGEMPPWAPCPQDDPLYEGLDVEQWDSVPDAMDIRRNEWADAVLTNRVGDVVSLVDDAVAARGLTPPRTGPAWRRLLRLALLAAADANAIDIAREQGNYDAGFPDACRIPATQMPAFVAEDDLIRTDPAGAPPLPYKRATSGPNVSFSVLYAQWTRSKAAWAPKTRAQAEAVQTRFTSLMGEMASSEITPTVAELFRTRLRQVPTLNGRSIYAGMTVREAAEAANRIEASLKANKGSIRFGGADIPRDRAAKLAVRLSLKTLNRDLTFLSDWGKWMKSTEDRRILLAEGDNPFANMLAKKKEVQRGERQTGRQAAAVLQAGDRSAAGKPARCGCRGRRWRTCRSPPLVGADRLVYRHAAGRDRPATPLGLPARRRR